MLDVTDLSPYVLQNLSERELISLIKRISAMLTQSREQIKSEKSYVFDEKMVSAYTLFYLPTNIPKLDFILSKQSSEFLDDLYSRPFIDYGTGPGTFTVAMSLKLKEMNKDVSLYAVEISDVMKRQAEKIFRGLNIKAKILHPAELKDLPQNSTLFIGHGLNEMEYHEIDELIAKTNPYNIIFIEPGTKDFFQKALKLRKYFCDNNYFCHYPCPQGERPCPMENNNDWCHQILRCALPSQVARLAGLAELNRSQMPMIAHIYSKMKPKREVAPLIRFKGESKFSWDWIRCQGVNGENVHQNLIFMKKYHKGEFKEGMTFKRAFDHLSVGDIPQIKIEEVNKGQMYSRLLDFSEKK